MPLPAKQLTIDRLLIQVEADETDTTFRLGDQSATWRHADYDPVLSDKELAQIAAETLSDAGLISWFEALQEYVSTDELADIEREYIRDERWDREHIRSCGRAARYI